MFSRLNDLNLRNDLKKSLRQFYFIAGNDSFLVDTCLNLIKEAVGGETVRIDFTEAETETVEEQLTTYSFTNKLLIIDNFKASEFNGEKKALYTELLSDIPSTLTVCTILLSEDPGCLRLLKTWQKLLKIQQLLHA